MSVEVATDNMATLSLPRSPVPLDTIPISPDGGNGTSKVANENEKLPDEQVVTVFHDPEHFNVKHPLASQWTLWFTKPPSGKV